MTCLQSFISASSLPGSTCQRLPVSVYLCKPNISAYSQIWAYQLQLYLQWLVLLREEPCGSSYCLELTHSQAFALSLSPYPSISFSDPPYAPGYWSFPTARAIADFHSASTADVSDVSFAECILFLSFPVYKPRSR